MQAGLVLRGPARVVPALHRRLFVTKDIERLLDGEPAGSFFSEAHANAKITDFLAGRLISVSQARRRWKKRDKPDFVRIDGADEVWEFCFRVPPPGWRLFGRFLEQGVFVGLRLMDRHDVEGLGYEAIAEEVCREWERVLPGCQPHIANDLDAYFGWTWRDIDDED